MAQCIATPSWLGRFFTRIKQLSFEKKHLVIQFNNQTSQVFLISDFNNFAQLEHRLFSAKLVLGDEGNTAISFIHKAQAKVLNTKINQCVTHFLNNKISNAKAVLKRTALDEYLRDSNLSVVQGEVFSLCQQYKKAPLLWQQYLTPSNVKFISVLASAATTKEAIAQLRDKYERQQLKQRAEFYNDIESNPLTIEQRLAVIRNNDKNLVLAAAGTGKTAVMVAKALDLIANNQALPEQILVLAYNKTAAQELKSRFVFRAQQAQLVSKPPTILTFHALGLQLLKQGQKNCDITPFANDPAALSAWLTQWLSEQMQTTPAFLSRFVSLLDKPLTNSAVNQATPSAKHTLEMLKDSGQLKQEVDKYIHCLHAIRAEQLSDTEIAARVVQAGEKNHRAAAKLLIAIHQAYIKQLAKEQQIDFDDMILLATQAVVQQQVSVPWRYILVDEFQDISNARMALLNSLIKHGQQVRFTAVGDDWQAIYRFSGGNLALTTRFKQLLGSHSLTLLQKTFRYNNSISDVAGRFVMQNPEQYKKYITTHTQVTEPQVILLDDMHQGEKSLELKTQQTINTIQKHHADARIVVLGRYRYLLNKVQHQLKSEKNNSNVECFTLHSAKGLEADYCIMIGLDQGRFGFPSEQRTNPLLECLLPSQDPYAYSEERRLFYVGLTRAKYKSYLIADPKQPSLFVSELINDDYPIHVASPLFNP